MQGISIFKQTYAAGASRVVMGFDSAINTYSPYAIGCIVGKSYAMAAAVVDEHSDQWHIVNLNTKHGFDAVAVLGAIDEDAAASIAMRDFGRFKESAMWDSVIATNTGGLKRYIDSPLCVRGRKVFVGEIGAMQDMAAGQKILWDGIELQSHQGSSRVLLSDMVQHDDESALVEKFDGLNAWLAESDVEVMEFDALVVENYRLEQTMAKLASAMGAASGQGGVSVTNVTQTKAVKLRNSGAIQVGVSFELSDGQAVTAIFNHADSETQKLGLKDTLFSWKWKLNSRDISAAVQPNSSENVKLNILAGRIMKLVNANSARFQRSQAKKLENEQALADGNARIAEKKATIESLKSEIESLHIQADEKAKADQAAIETKVEDQPHEPEQHYSEKIIAQLIAAHGWTKTDTTNSAEKEFAGLDPSGLLSDGGRILVATFRDEAKRYLRLEFGYDDIQYMDMRPYDGDDEAIAEGAKVFNAMVEEFVLSARGVGVAVKEVDVGDLSNYGEVEITDIGEENIHFTKNGKKYFSKVGDTEKYEIGLYNFKEPQLEKEVFATGSINSISDALDKYGRSNEIDIDKVEAFLSKKHSFGDTSTGIEHNFAFDYKKGLSSIFYLLSLNNVSKMYNEIRLDSRNQSIVGLKEVGSGLQFNKKVDINTYISNGGGATGLEIVPRKGHVLFKFYIDTNSKNMTPISVLDVADFTKALTDIEQNENVDTQSSYSQDEQVDTPATNPDAEYLQAIIDGTADLSVAGDELERIGDNLSPELEELFEEAAEAYAQYAIGLEV